MQSIDQIRAQFPALCRQINGQTAVYLDGPAGSQVPQSVVDRIVDGMLNHNANRSGQFATSREVDALMAEAHQTAADFLNAPDPNSIAFGPNMTSLTLQFSRAVATTWKPGDEVVVSRLDHDANFTPWILAARDAGATIKYIDVNTHDATLNMNSLQQVLTPRTRLVAVTAASNAVGSLTPIRMIADAVHSVGAELFVDAVHYAPHRLIDVVAWDCDYLVCSGYKFFGPHIGVLYGRTQRMIDVQPYKLRPSPNSLPGRWMTGTQNHACISGLAGAVDYLASLSQLDPMQTSRRERLEVAMREIEAYESGLIQQLIRGLQSMAHIKLFGITDPEHMHLRAPTVAFQVRGSNSIEVAARLGDQGIFVWHGNYYALPLTEALGTEPAGMVRVGCMHYNTAEEIDRTLAALVQQG